ncbi:hypothetical protein LTS10_007516 [Elasticomyces elasticus]|nr:hypothetical protein LTS10_007516 [Elasticomyces elasticus]
MATAGVVEIDPNGDVFLLCGGEVTSNNVCKLRVSSAALRLGSPVFKSLLGPRFKEGNALLDCATVEVPLPEDDPGNMQKLCQILHFRNDQMLAPLNAEEVMDFAILCDKYGCANAVRLCVELWVRDPLTTTSVQDLAIYFNAALLLKYEELVQRLGARLIKDAKKFIAEIVKPEGSKQKFLCAELENIRARFLRNLAHIIEDELDNVLYHQKGSKCKQDCPVNPRRVVSFAQQLRDADLWPGFKRMGCVEIDLQCAETFVAQVISSDLTHISERCGKGETPGLKEYSRAVNKRAKHLRRELDGVDLSSLNGA